MALLVDRRLAAALALLPGCGYTSTYTAPDGWRARPVYSGNDVEWIGATELPKCASEPPAPPPHGPPPEALLDDRGYWSPRGHVFITHVGPPHAHVSHPPGPHGLFLSGLRGASGSRGSWSASGGGSSSKGAGMVFALAAALALAASSGIAVGLAADPPEDSDVADAIDDINRFNDEARRAIAGCYEVARASPPATEAPPAEAPGEAP